MPAEKYEFVLFVFSLRRSVLLKFVKSSFCLALFKLINMLLWYQSAHIHKIFDDYVYGDDDDDDDDDNRQCVF